MHFPDIDTFDDLFASGLPIKTSSYSFRDLLLSDPNLSKLEERLYFAKDEAELNSDGRFAGFQRINVYNLQYFKDIKFLKSKRNYRWLHTMKECLSSFFISYAIPKNSPYKKRIDEIISVVDSAGLIIKWNGDSAKYIFEKYQLVTKNRVHIKVFSLHDLEVAFCVLFIGLVCSTAILIAEIITRKFWPLDRKNEGRKTKLRRNDILHILCTR